jgi:sec-independent protein translocase protein TatA
MIGDILQPTHLLLILAVVLLVLGPKRLPEAGRSLGRGLRDFRDGLSGNEPETTVTSSESEPTGTAPE